MRILGQDPQSVQLAFIESNDLGPYGCLPVNGRVTDIGVVEALELPASNEKQPEIPFLWIVFQFIQPFDKLFWLKEEKNLSVSFFHILSYPAPHTQGEVVQDGG